MREKNVWIAISIVGIWAAVAIASIFSPDLVTGTNPDHFPIAAAVGPIFGAFASFAVAFVALVTKEK